MDLVSQQSANNRGLQEGYSQEQWGPWKSHGMLLQQSIAELGLQESEQILVSIFKEHCKIKDGLMSREEFFTVMELYSCCQPAHIQVFFQLFDRNQDEYLSETDFVSGILAVSPLTPHKLDSAPGQLRMQLIFLYYDANRNGRLEVEEVAKMIEHIQQLRGQPHSDAMVDATALTSLYQGPFGFAAFHDAAQKRMLNGTSPLLRLQQDLPDVFRKKQGSDGQAAQIHGQQITSWTTRPDLADLPVLGSSVGGVVRQSSGPGAVSAVNFASMKPDDGLASLASLPASLGVSPGQSASNQGSMVQAAAVAANAAAQAAAAQQAAAAVTQQAQTQAAAAAQSARSPSASSPLGQARVGHMPPPGQEYWRGGGDAPAGGAQVEAEAIALRVVRRLMELSNQEHTEWRYSLQLASSREVLLLCGIVVEILRREDSLIEVPLPVRVYGDIHGQLLDLLEFFNAFAWPDKRRGDIWSMSYIFLGDFVDRGAYSCDVVTLLFSLKILYPRKIFLVRGNHEDRLMNINYGFHENCMRLFLHEGQLIWERTNDVFEFLPIAAIVDGTTLCIHGGIGDCINSINDLRGIPKPIQVVGEINSSTTRQDRIILHALWSDPTDNDQVLGVHTSPRGKNTCRFGPDRVHDFNQRNGLKLIIRAHECVQHGYEYFAAGQLLTVFSATNYCNEHNNDGAMVILVRDAWTGEVKEHAQVIKSGSVDTSFGWNDQQFRAPSPMRRRDENETVSRGSEW